MNKTETIALVSEKTALPPDTCERILKAFEKQSEAALLGKLDGAKNNRATMLAGLSEKTAIPAPDCDKALAALEEVLGQSLAGKLKFWK